ncbi:MAG: hypothetical protein VB055_08135 [Oscillospiraceae bacterium]|nr:hypothetical protein [Oscillospiraceae bacterium]
MEILGVIFCQAAAGRLSPLAREGPLAALPFGGGLLVDFPLSAMAAAGIRDVLLLTPGCGGALAAHVGSGRTWGLRQKRGGVRFVRAETGPGTFPMHALRAALPEISRSTADAVLLMGCGLVYLPDLRTLAGALGDDDGALLYTPQVRRPMAGDSVRLEGRHARLERGCFCQSDLFLGCLLLRREVLCALLGCDSGAADLTELLEGNLCAVPHTGYVGAAATPEGYLQASLELLQPEVRAELYRAQGGMVTPVPDSPPTRYLEGAAVRQSLIGGGGRIAGSVTNSLLFADVEVGEDARVEGSVLLPGCRIGKGCRLRFAVCGRDVTLSPGLSLSGQPEYPFLLSRTQQC